MAHILGIDHIQLAITPGAEAVARQFYGAVLGLTELPKPQEMAGRGGLWFALGPQQLHLGGEAGFSPSKKVHPALLVDDLDWFLARLTQAACTIDTSLQIPGVKRAFTFDPFGNRIELMQKL